MAELTQRETRRLFNYDSETGVLTRRIRGGPRAEKGCVVGHHDGSGYLRVTINKKRYLVHRIIWLWIYGKFPKHELDHINHNRADNRRLNLREVKHQENSRNMKKYSNNTSGVTGVYWIQEKLKWRSDIMVDGKTVSLGYFQEFNKAVRARKDAEKEHCFHENHGEVVYG